MALVKGRFLQKDSFFSLKYWPDDADNTQDFSYEIAEIAEDYILVQLTFEQPLNVSTSVDYDKVFLEIDKERFG